MGLDDFVDDSDDDYEVVSTPDSDAADPDRTVNTSPPSAQWTTKLDFSKPYVIVAEDKQGEFLVSKGDVIVIEDADDWRRLDDNPHREVNVLAEWGTKVHWLNFCNLAVDQYDEDPTNLLQDDIERLIELDEEVYWPPGSKPSSIRTCRVCGDTDNTPKADILELDLHETRKVPVCSRHSVEELAESGLLS